jgi:hypothetical protein
MPTRTSGYAPSRSRAGALPNWNRVNVIGVGAPAASFRIRAHTVNGVRG